jgi:hypothetical protein
MINALQRSGGTEPVFAVRGFPLPIRDVLGRRQRQNQHFTEFASDRTRHNFNDSNLHSKPFTRRPERYLDCDGRAVERNGHSDFHQRINLARLQFLDRGKGKFDGFELSAGAHSLTATYNGNEIDAPSTSTILIQIVRSSN